MFENDTDKIANCCQLTNKLNYILKLATHAQLKILPDENNTGSDFKSPHLSLYKYTLTYRILRGIVHTSV